MASMTDTTDDQPIHVPPELQQMWADRQRAFVELTRSFAAEHGLVHEPVFNYGYNEWPTEDQAAFDVLARAHDVEWAEKIATAFPAAP